MQLGTGLGKSHVSSVRTPIKMPEQPKPDKTSQVRCRTCGKFSPSSLQFCQNDGTALPRPPGFLGRLRKGIIRALIREKKKAQEINCLNCNKANPSSSRFCGYCGRALPAPAASLSFIQKLKLSVRVSLGSIAGFYLGSIFGSSSLLSQAGESQVLVSESIGVIIGFVVLGSIVSVRGAVKGAAIGLLAGLALFVLSIAILPVKGDLTTILALAILFGTFKGGFSRQ
jgi:hypothetical protein